MKREIILNSLNEELIPYTEPGWQHSLEYTTISERLLGYIPLHWHEELQFVAVVKGTIELHILGRKINLPEGSGFLSILGLFMKSMQKHGILHLFAGISGLHYSINTFRRNTSFL